MILNDEHNLIRESVRDFAEREIKPLAKELDENQEFSIELTIKMGEIGLFGMVIPQEYGGQGLDHLSYIIAVEEIARIDGSQAATIAAGNSLGVNPIYKYGTENQKKKYLPELCSGEALWGFGLTEPEAGSDSRATKTTARLIDNEWIINGSKIFITNASTSITLGSTIQVITGEKDGKKEFSAILVENGTPGFTAKTMHNKLMWRASNTSELYFDDCKVPKENLLGHLGYGSKIMLSTLDCGRLSIAAMGLGLAQGAYEMALQYAQERKQFGQSIGKNQAIQWMLADMTMDTFAMENMVYRTAWMCDQGNRFSRESAIVKAFCSEKADRIIHKAIQLHGGIGYMKEYPLERFYRDSRINLIFEGTNEIQRMIIARDVMKKGGY